MNEMVFMIIGAALLLIPTTITDLKSRLVPTWYILIIGVIGIILRMILLKTAVWELALGLMPGLLFLAVSLLSKGKIGVGDGWIFVALGGICGFGFTLSAALIALLSAIIVGGILVLRKKMPKGAEFPFVPFIAGATLLEWGLELIFL